MLQPKKTKYRKTQKGVNRGLSVRWSRIVFGSFALKATKRGFMTPNQIESARRVISRQLKRAGKLWIRVFPDKPITQHAAEAPMGKGKGAIDHYAAVIKPGRIIFELDGVPEELAKKALALAAYKLPVTVKFISKN